MHAAALCFTTAQFCSILVRDIALSTSFFHVVSYIDQYHLESRSMMKKLICCYENPAFRKGFRYYLLYYKLFRKIVPLHLRFCRIYPLRRRLHGLDGKQRSQELTHQ